MSDQPVEETFPILALDIGGTKIGWAIVDEVEGELSIIESDAIATRANEGGPAVADRICGLVEEIHQRFPAITLKSLLPTA